MQYRRQNQRLFSMEVRGSGLYLWASRIHPQMCVQEGDALEPDFMGSKSQLCTEWPCDLQQVTQLLCTKSVS